MCTVTYLPLGNSNFILTSNRDEDPKRETLHPATYKEDGVSLSYPKDKIAGGTWIGVSNKNRLICLLNGGFVKHKRAASYKMSRGVVVKNILKIDNPVSYIKEFDFSNIEPFTIVFVDWSETLTAYELVWDGDTKHFQELKQEPKIWSSSTLYDEQMKQDRKEWFAEWLEKNPNYDVETIANFHLSTDKGTDETTLKMKRSYVETVSVTTVAKEESLVFTYRDLLKGENTELQF